MSNDPLIPYSTTLHVRDHCLCLYAQRAARILARRFDQALRPLSLTNGQFSLMMSLNRPEPPALGEVADLLGMDRTTLTAALKALERKGWVRTEKSPRDGRERMLSLTQEGTQLLANAVPIWTRTHEELEKTMPQGGADRLRHDLTLIR